MNEDAKVSTKESNCEGSDIFEVWKEYERIAMHFNQLIIQLRARALAGIAAISALVGFISKGEAPEEFRWGILTAVFVILIIVWVAIWFLDSRYYNRLLVGSIRAILEIEKASKTQTKLNELNMSHRIEESVAGNFSGLQKESFWSGRRWFYGLVLFALIFSAYFSLSEHCLKSSDTGLAHKHGICRITIHWGEPADKEK